MAFSKKPPWNRIVSLALCSVSSTGGELDRFTRAQATLCLSSVIELDALPGRIKTCWISRITCWAEILVKSNHKQVSSPARFNIWSWTLYNAFSVMKWEPFPAYWIYLLISSSSIGVCKAGKLGLGKSAIMLKISLSSITFVKYIARNVLITSLASHVLLLSTVESNSTSSRDSPSSNSSKRIRQFPKVHSCHSAQRFDHCLFPYGWRIWFFKRSNPHQYP